jgi:HlyD family secretion protein
VKRLGMWTAAAALLAALGLGLACGSGAADAKRSHILVIESRAIELKLVEYGEIQAREVRSVTSPISGEIIWVCPEGTQLKRGEVVLKMNTDDLVSRLEEDTRAGVGLEGRLATKIAVSKAVALNRKAAVSAAELDLEIARQRLAEVRSHPTAAEKQLADLDLQAAQLRKERAAAEEKALRDLLGRGFSSEAKAKSAQLSLIRTKAELARARAAHRETLAGRPPETIRARVVSVKKAEMSLAQARFNAQADVEAAKQEIAVARTRFEVYRQRLERTKGDIAAADAKTSIDGVVALVDVWKGSSEMSPVQVGETHRRGREMLKMADVSSLRIKVQINERDIIGLRVGQRARARLISDPGRVYGARVARIAPFADDKNRQLGHLAMEKSGLAGVNVVAVYLDLELPEGVPPPRLGSSALVEIVTARLPAAISVPSEALTWREGQAFVTKVRGDGYESVKVTVKIGTSQDAVVESGLAVGDRIVLPARAGEAALVRK